jgi:hypothetical protein
MGTFLNRYHPWKKFGGTRCLTRRMKKQYGNEVLANLKFTDP